ncbi:MAG: arsenate reductase [Alphaproteobacteria bacterium]|jgi:arsenate reductase
MILYGIKNCDTVKKARKYLEKHNIAYTFHDFRADGLLEEKVANWLSMVGMDVLVNKRSTTWKSLSEDEKNAVDIRLICAQPTLIKRPVLELDDHIIIGYRETEYGDIVSS